MITNNKYPCTFAYQITIVRFNSYLKDCSSLKFDSPSFNKSHFHSVTLLTLNHENHTIKHD